ncbi:MAG: rod shape-determining protein MreC [Bacteroidetes bacterium RIFCSPLOWO2_12_FULL_35_15]|nr:MAG: rod shape-determining protein MreC [Bacteroidetes bacterium RIFCSPLOWO2_12_FULL_35_15]
MRNLILFIWKHYFVFLFLLLETLCVYLVVQNNNFQRAGFVNSSNQVSASVLSTAENIQQYFYLKSENERLAKENAELHSHDLLSFSVLVNDQYSVNDTLFRQKYSYTSAKVVNNSTNRRNNFLTLDKGSKQGITNKMGVISSSGVIGIVKDVSENFCTVMSVLHSKTTISAKLKKDGTFGPLNWDGESFAYATLNDIPTHVRLVQGDTIVTSQYTKMFPENILIGTVESYFRESAKPFYTVKVKLSTDFKKLTYVYIVNNMLKGEQEILEKNSEADKKE